MLIVDVAELTRRESVQGTIDGTVLPILGSVGKSARPCSGVLSRRRCAHVFARSGAVSPDRLISRLQEHALA